MKKVLLAIAQTQLALLEASALLKYAAPWRKVAKSVLRNEAGQFASEGKALGRATGKVSQTFEFASPEAFINANVTRIETKAGSSRFATCEIEGQKYFLKSRTGESGEIAAQQEELCSKIATTLGLGDYVIPAKKVKVQYKTYTASPHLENDTIFFEQDKTLRELIGDDGVKKIGLFDLLIGNGDRNGGNIFIGGKKGALFFDHEATFSRFPVFEGEVAEEFLEIADKVTKKDIEAILSKEQDILKAIAEVPDQDAAKRYTQAVKNNLEILRDIAQSKDIAKEFRSL